MAILTISVVADRAGIKPSAIRYYESIGLLPAPPRKSGRRQYDETTLTRLQIIDIAKSFDFTLDEIKLFFQGVSEQSPPSDIWNAFATAKLKEIKEQIVRAQQLRNILETGLSCKCLTLTDCKISCVPLDKS
jgi:MerR family transcriptional regulator, redox-sensitive transcriptional activator SoxR